MATFKKFRKDEIQVTPYEAHKEYLVYVGDYTGSYHEPYYEQSRIFNNPITSSTILREAEVSLSVYTYDAVYDDTDFFPDEYGKYQSVLSASGHARTTNGWFKRAMHASIQGMYYTNPDDPCYTLDNSGYEKEFRELNETVQVLSVPQRMFGDSIMKRSVDIQSGIGAARRFIFDDGNGNLYDNYKTGSIAGGSIISGSVLNYVSKSIFALNFNDMYNESGNVVSAHSINALNTFTQDKGNRFSIKNSTRFFERSRYPNEVELYNCIPNKHTPTNGTVLDFNGKTSPTSADRSRPESQSILIAKNQLQFDLRQEDDYAIALRISASEHQPSSESIDATDPHQYIVSKFDDTRGGQYPFCIKLCNNNADGTAAEGIPGGIQVSIDNGKPGETLRLNSTTPITASATDFHNIAFVKSGTTAELWINGTKEAFGTVPTGKIHNGEDIVIGARTAWKGNYTRGDVSNKANAPAGATYSRKTKPEIEYYRHFSGSLSSIMIFNNALSPAEIAFGHATNGLYSNHVGNVFYNHGIMTITDPGDEYLTPAGVGMLSECTLSFKNTHTIFEHEYSCHIKEREFTSTMNPTIIEDDKTSEVKHFVTQSSWSPYVTTVGLYDSHARLLAIGKLSKPIKKSDEYDTTFIVRYDT